jgi:hypothetical protein
MVVIDARHLPEGEDARRTPRLLLTSVGFLTVLQQRKRTQTPRKRAS